MKRKDKAKAKRQEAAAPGMGIDSILAQLASLKDNARDSMTGSDDFDEVWKKDIAACEAATAILSALQDEGIRDPDEVRDLIADYNALAKQYQELHRKFEVGDKPQPLGGMHFCPECHRRSRPGDNHCWNCGKRLDWDRR